MQNVIVAQADALIGVTNMAELLAAFQGQPLDKIKEALEELKAESKNAAELKIEAQAAQDDARIVTEEVGRLMEALVAKEKEVTEQSTALSIATKNVRTAERESEERAKAREAAVVARESEIEAREAAVVARENDAEAKYREAEKLTADLEKRLEAIKQAAA